MLDLFSIARSLRAGQEAYTQGQKEQADKYWSDIENSLKVAASAQEMKYATQIQPYKVAKSAQEVQTEQAQTFSTEQLGRAREIKAKTDQDIYNALKSGYSKYQTDNPESKLSYNEWMYQNYPNLGPASEKAKEAVRTQEETTKLRTAQTTGAEATAEVNRQKVEAGINEAKGYEALGTNKGAVMAGTEFAQMEKAKQDVEIAKATVSLRKLQADVARNNAQRIKEGKSPADMNPYQKLKQFQVDMIEDLISQGIPENEAYDTVMNQPKQLTYANISSMLNSLRNQLSTEFDDTKKAEIQEKINMYESILQPALDRMAGKKTTSELAENQIRNVPSVDFRSWDPDTRTKWLRKNANDGMRRIYLVDVDDKIISTLNIRVTPDGAYEITDSNGKIVGRLTPKTPTTKTTGKPTQTSTQTTPQAQPNSKAQVFVQSLKSKGITSINQLEPDIIQALKDQGIYDQVRKLLGG